MGKDLKGKELGIGISQRKDGLYTARFVNKEGKRCQKYFPKLQECRNWLADAKFQDKHSNLRNREDLSVNGWFEQWIGMKEKTVRFHTVNNYRDRYKNNIEPMIGKMLLKDVKPIHCQQIFNKMMENGYKKSTMAQVRITLHNMFEYAKDNDIILSNPCKKTVKSDIGKDSKQKEALTIEQQKKFLNTAFGSAYYNQYAFILQTGLRTGELMGLRWNDIDFNRKIVHIQRTVGYYNATKVWKAGPPKSKSADRIIPLTDEAIKILKRQKEKNIYLKTIKIEWADTVFLGKDGCPVKNDVYDGCLIYISRKAGIPNVSMHMLRHTFATRCIEAGMKPKTLQTVLGHSSWGITMNIYVHITEDERLKEMLKVEKALNMYEMLV